MTASPHSRRFSKNVVALELSRTHVPIQRVSLLRYLDVDCHIDACWLLITWQLSKIHIDVVKHLLNKITNAELTISGDHDALGSLPGPALYLKSSYWNRLSCVARHTRSIPIGLLWPQQLQLGVKRRVGDCASMKKRTTDGGQFWNRSQQC